MQPSSQDLRHLRQNKLSAHEPHAGNIDEREYERVQKFRTVTGHILFPYLQNYDICRSIICAFFFFKVVLSYRTHAHDLTFHTIYIFPWNVLPTIIFSISQSRFFFNRKHCNTYTKVIFSSVRLFP